MQAALPSEPMQTPAQETATAAHLNQSHPLWVISCVTAEKPPLVTGRA
jgi:hypothetical protein